MADAVIAAGKDQKTPDGYYNMERMLKRVAAKGAALFCGTCMDARHDRRRYGRRQAQATGVAPEVGMGRSASAWGETRPETMWMLPFLG